MILYDGESSVVWFYDGTMTAEEMMRDREKRELFEVPCVLYDDGAGKVYSYEKLVDACMKACVPYTGVPAQDFATLESYYNGTYVAPGVVEAQATADEAKAIAEQTKTTADTAAASVNEYMDALLGLDSIATNETEATDAE